MSSGPHSTHGPQQQGQDTGPGEPRSGEGAESALARLQREEKARVHTPDRADEAPDPGS